MTLPPVHEGEHHPTLSLCLWLVVQLVVLGLAAGEVALSAGFSRPPAQLAIDELLVVQFACSGMLFPLLLVDFSSTLIAILTAGPLIQLGGILSHSTEQDLALGWCCLALWLGALAMVSQGIARDPRRRAHLALIPMVNLISIGGLVLWYLESEFGPGARIGPLFPLPALLRAMNGRSGFGPPLCSSGAVLVAAVVFRAILHFRGES